MYDIFVTDVQGNPVAKLDLFTSANVVKRFRAVGAWSIDAPHSEAAQALATQGSRLMMLRDGEFFFSGPTTEFTLRYDGVGYTWTFAGLSEDQVLWDRICWPCAYDPVQQRFPAADQDVQTGPLETIVKHYVSANVASPVASRDQLFANNGMRRITVAANQGRGPLVTTSARFNVVGDLLTTCASGTDYGFAVRNWVFDIYETSDLSDTVVLSSDTGNVLDFEVTTTRGTLSTPYIAGQGEGVNRFVGRPVEVADGWVHMAEKFIDRRDTGEANELVQTANEEIDRSRSSQQIKISPLDTPGRTYGVDYHLGDKIKCQDIVGVVTEVTLTLDDKGAITRPSIDSEGRTAANRILKHYDTLRGLERRLSLLERVV